MKKTRHRTFVVTSKRIRDEARDFSEWLNSDGEARDLFRPLVKLTAAVTKHELQRKRHTDVLEPSDPYLSYERKIGRLLAKIERRYPSQLKLADWGNQRGLPTFARQPIREASLKAEAAVATLEQFCELANVGAFAAFEMCALPSCGRYVFAFPRHKRYCSEEHQRTHYDDSAERKQRNKSYQKKHYREYESAAAKRLQKLAARRGWSTRLPLSVLKKRLREAK
jgi:hypothetical protein